MREKLTFFCFLFGFLVLLDQVVLTSPIPDTKLRYSWLTTQRQSVVGFIEPSCSAIAYRLTLVSRTKLASNHHTSVSLSTWQEGHGFLKLPTWGCGLAFYDYGGGIGRAEKMFRWGEGRIGAWFGQRNTHCGEVMFILVEEARLLCVSGADVGLT